MKTNTGTKIDAPKFYILINSKRIGGPIKATQVKPIIAKIKAKINPSHKISVRECGSNRLVMRVTKWI